MRVCRLGCLAGTPGRARPHGGAPAVLPAVVARDVVPAMVEGAVRPGCIRLVGGASSPKVGPTWMVLQGAV